ncbi:MAG: cytochrome c biogenesis protein CcsA [Muribaculaceae bacterium]|nr:cytochrome c biogenesis protein CcsA [Muribaculaceae bacterium]
MRQQYLRFLKYTSFGSTCLIIVVLIAATILEKNYGHDHVYTLIYGSPLTVALWSVMALSSLLYLIGRKTFTRLPVICLHLSFSLILAGALVTHILGKQGSLHLRQDSSPVTSFRLADGTYAPLPFTVSLESFRLEYYTGTIAPMDYVSRIIIHDGSSAIHGNISMNKILSHRNYRFYQSGYDKDGKGTLLAISYDPYGIAITYSGYILLLLSMVGYFFYGKSAFRSLLAHPSLRRTAMTLFLVGCSAAAIRAGAQPQSLPQPVAEKFCDMYVSYNDRICPLHTLAKDFTVKIYGRDSYRGLSAEQVLTGWFFFYDDWKHEPVIKIKGNRVRELLGITGDYAALSDFTGINGYKLDNALHDRGTGTRDIGNANEKFNIISMLCTGSLLKIYPCRNPADSTLAWYSLADRLPADIPDGKWAFIRNSMDCVAEKIAMHNDSETVSLLDGIRRYQIKEGGDAIPSETRFFAEKLYNDISYNRTFAMLCLTIGIIAFIIYCRRKQPRWLHSLLVILSCITFIYLTANIALRWYISNHIPLSNGFETMQFMAWCSLMLSFPFRNRFYLSLPFGFLICGLSLLVAMIGESNPQVTPLIPVLKSPLLSIHVVAIMTAYSLLAFTMLNGLTAIILHYSGKRHQEEISHLCLISRIILYPAVFLLVAGIFVGAVWANVSWGRYWGWDPKEVWALVTMLIYAFPLHRSSLGRFDRPIFFHWFCILAFLSVLVTYFGVNFFLGGMHSYA